VSNEYAKVDWKKHFKWIILVTSSTRVKKFQDDEKYIRLKQLQDDDMYSIIKQLQHDYKYTRVRGI